MEMEGESLFLPEELEIEVLLRFPVKSLVRFKSVCKRWHSLIRSPSFISRYNRLAANTRKNNGKLLCFREDPITRTHYISLFDDQTVEKINDLEWPPFLDEGIEEVEENYTRGISILGPVNGIYCIYRRLIEWWVGALVLWNPATREYKHILRPISFPFSSNLLAGLWNLHQDFDEMRYGKYIDIGFGFDQTTNDYKLVVICHSRLAYGPGDEFWHVRVFSCATDSWKTICSLYHGDVFPQFDLGYPPFPEIYSNPEHSHCLLNGVYHWTCIVMIIYPGADLEYPILAFDFADEAFRLMRGPHLPPKDHEQPRSLWVLRETLALVATCCESVEVWVMMECGVESSWSMLYSFEHTVGLAVAGIPNDVRIFFRVHNDGQLVSFGLEDNEVKEHDIYVRCMLIPSLFMSDVATLGILQYVETLTPLKPIESASSNACD